MVDKTTAKGITMGENSPLWVREDDLVHRADGGGQDDDDGHRRNHQRGYLQGEMKLSNKKERGSSNPLS